MWGPLQCSLCFLSLRSIYSKDEKTKIPLKRGCWEGRLFFFLFPLFLLLSDPLCAVKFLFASVIYKEGSRTGKQTKENNVSINASKETCVANGFSETIGSEGVTLPLH